MVGIKRHFLRFQVRGSSLIEVTTAMVIISLLFSVSVVIFLNVQRTGLSNRKLSYDILLHERYMKSMKDSTFTTLDDYYGNVRIHQEIGTSHLGKNLVVLSLEIREESGKLVAKRKHLLYVHEDI